MGYFLGALALFLLAASCYDSSGWLCRGRDGDANVCGCKERDIVLKAASKWSFLNL